MQAARIRERLTGLLLGNGVQHLKPVIAEIAATEISNFVHQLSKIHQLLIELELAGVAAGEVEEIVEQHAHANAFLFCCF